MARWHTTEFDMLPENAFRPRGWKGGMTMEGGGGGSAPAPDPWIAKSQQAQADIATDMWNTFKTDIYPGMRDMMKLQEARATEQWDISKQVAQRALDRASRDYARYEQGAVPAMEAIRREAVQYNEPGYQEKLAQQAAADVNTQYDIQRQQNEMRQRQYGIDPTAGVYQTNAQSMAAQQALTSAAAQNQVRTAAHELGLQKQANLVNMYSGVLGQGNASTTLGLNTTTQGFNLGQQALGGYAQTGGTLSQGTGTALSGWQNVGQLGVQKYQTDVQAYNAQQQASAGMWGGLGSAVGSGIGLYAKMSGGGGAASAAPLLIA